MVLRLSCLAAAVGLGVVAIASPAHAADPRHAALDATRAAIWKGEPDALSHAILVELTRRAVTTKADPDRDWLNQLGQFYAHHTGTAFWTTDTGALSPAALAAADEIGRADYWGLDARAYEIPVAAGPAPAQRAATEVAFSLVLAKYAAHARGGRVDPSQLSRWLDQRPRAIDTGEVVAAVATAGDPAAAVRALHPRHPAFEVLRNEYVRQRGLVERKTRVAQVPPGPRLKPGDVHMDVRFLRTRLGIPGQPGNETTFDKELVDALGAYMRSVVGRGNKRVLDDEARDLLNNPPPAKVGKEVKKLLVNMERWRWLPDDLGAFHIWNNLPEYETRVVRNGAVIHQERIIIGKPDTQTPVFSNAMQYVVFQPEWNVPNSIKVKQLLPHLQDGDFDELERRNMRIVGKNGKALDPDYFDWDRTDIRFVPIAQGSGDDNPLGQMKFMFPNKHDVYMHDTSSKHLFSSATRTFSHGCIRVRNPRKLAEIVFAQTAGWSPWQVAENLTTKAPQNNRIDLMQTIPVHNAYFTLVVDDQGAIRSLPDVYGHDSRITRALEGTPAHIIAADDPALQLAQEIEELAPEKPGQLVRNRR